METKRDFDLMALYTKFKNITIKGSADEEAVLKIVAEILDILPKADKYIVDMEEELKDQSLHADRMIIDEFEFRTGKKVSDIKLFTVDSYAIYEGPIEGLIKNLHTLAAINGNRLINDLQEENKALKDSNECYLKLIKRYRKKLNKQKRNAEHWRIEANYQKEQYENTKKRLNNRVQNVLYLNDILTVLNDDKKHLQTDLKMARENHMNLMNAYNDLVVKTSDYESIKQAKETFYHEWQLAEDLIKHRDNTIARLRGENDELRTKNEKLVAKQCKGTPGVDPQAEEKTKDSSVLVKYQYYIRIFANDSNGDDIIHKSIKPGDKVVSIFSSDLQSQCQILRDNTYISIIVEKDSRNTITVAQVLDKDDNILYNMHNVLNIVDYISKL